VVPNRTFTGISIVQVKKSPMRESGSTLVWETLGSHSPNSDLDSNNASMIGHSGIWSPAHRAAISANDALEPPQIPDLTANFSHVVQSQRTDLGAGVVVSINESQETTKLIKPET
jgi:hypothetical protein